MTPGHRRAVGVAGLLAMIIATVAVVADFRGGETAARSDPYASPRASARVERTTMREKQVVSGTYGYEAPTPVAFRTSPTPPASAGKKNEPTEGKSAQAPPDVDTLKTLTGLRAVGVTVRRNGILFRVNERPVRLFYGDVPAWRDLEAGARGRDVRQLQSNLAAVGAGPVTVDGVFSKDTAAAVRRWQQATKQPMTGRVALGSVVFARGARRVTTNALLVGALLNDGVTVLQTTSVGRRVRLSLSADDRRLAAVGRAVRVTLPDQSVVRGRITKVGPMTADSASAADGNAASTDGANAGTGAKAISEVVVRLDRAQRRIDGATVSVALTRLVRRHVLAVPVTALTARRGGGYAVRVIRRGQTTAVPVTVGMFSDGLAEIEGKGIHEGDRVAAPDGA